MLARDLQLTPGPRDFLASAGQGPPLLPSWCWDYLSSAGQHLQLARDLQLTHSPWNFLASALNDIALSKLKGTGMLPEEQYSNKGSTFEDACLEKTLAFDIS